DRRDLDHLIVRDVPRWERHALKVTRWLAVRLLKRGLRIDAGGAERSRNKIEQTFARVSDLVRDGRRFLVGNRFTVADLTFAALAAPVVLPPNHPAAQPSLEHLSEPVQHQIEAWRATQAGQFALRIYQAERFARTPD